MHEGIPQMGCTPLLAVPCEMPRNFCFHLVVRQCVEGHVLSSDLLTEGSGALRLHSVLSDQIHEARRH